MHVLHNARLTARIEGIFFDQRRQFPIQPVDIGHTATHHDHIGIQDIDHGRHGAGKPVDLEGYFKLPEHLRVAFSILKSANCVPAEVELLNEIATLEQQLHAAPEDGKRAIRRALTDRRTQLAVVLERARRA